MGVYKLSLSVRADIYSIFGVFSNICQEVDILPFERYDRVKSVLEKFQKMLKTIDHSDCPRTISC